jgi:hypothetical protein
MTESQFSAKLLRALRQRMPSAVVWKLSDRFVTGMPDAVVIYDGIASWFEFKVGVNQVTKIQIETLARLKRGYLLRYISKDSWEITKAVKGNPGSPFYFGYGQTMDELIWCLENICKQP